MDENLFNEINAPARKKSIRDIPLPDGKKNYKPERENSYPKSSDIVIKKNTESEKKVSDHDYSEDYELNERPRKKRSNEKKNRNYNKPAILSGGLVLLITMVVVFMNIFAKAEITLEIKEESLSLQNVVIDITSNEESENDFLIYNNLNIEKSDSVIVEALQQELVQERASGRVVVRNAFSENTQNWIRDTRFESPNGLIFRTPTGISIPGHSESNGEIIPGEIEIEIVADNFGEEYNLPIGTKFTIPAFIGQESFDFYSAEAITNMEGGFDGVRRIVAESDLETATENLQNNLRNILISELDNQRPDNVLFFQRENNIFFDQVRQNDAPNNSVELSLNGRISFIAIDKNKLASAIASSQITDYRSNDLVYIENIEDLEINLVEDDGQTSLVLSGDIKIRWKIDTDELANELAGSSQSKMRDVLAEYRGIVSASSDFSPFWKNSFPENVRRIRINKK